jgi:hypothetical protein
MTTPEPPRPLNNPRRPPYPGYNRIRYGEQRRNISRAIGLLSARLSGPEPHIVKMYQSAVAGAFVAAEQASAARDAASPT